MAGSGKTTIGEMLASRLNKSFIDSDRVIEDKFEMSLQHILEKYGYLRLIEIEAEVLKNIFMNGAVLATGGSSIYNSKAIEHIAKQSKLIYLHVSLPEILNRVGSFENRGFAKHPNQSIKNVFEEREVLYEKYADIIIQNNHSAESSVQEIIRLLE